MRSIAKALCIAASLVIVPSATWAQVALSGTVKDAPGATPSGSWPGTSSYMNPRAYRLNAEFAF
jgi:hypothetical protein